MSLLTKIGSIAGKFIKEKIIKTAIEALEPESVKEAKQIKSKGSKILSRLRKILKIGETKDEEEAQKSEEEEAGEAEIIINNFLAAIKEMTSESYSPIGSHNFNPAHPLTDEGTRSKETSYGWIKEIVDKAISKRGISAVAQAIQDNGEYLQQLAEDLVFAIYEGKYAKWGGGAGSYTIAEVELERILTGIEE